MTDRYNWVNNPTVAGFSSYNPDILNECLMHLKYNNLPVNTNRYCINYGNTDYKGNPDLFDAEISTNLVYSQPGVYNVTIPTSANYEVILVGGGAGGARGLDTFAIQSTSSGASGACFYGIIYIPAGTYTLTVGQGGNSAENGQYGEAGGVTSIGNLISASGGSGGAYASWGQLVGSNGGVVSCNTNIISAEINSSGNNGTTQYNGNSTGGASLYNGYGKGGDASVSASYNGTSGFLSISLSVPGYINYKVGGSYRNLTGTSVDGEQFTITGLNSDDVSSLSDGKYIKYVSPDATSEIRKNNYYSQKLPPALQIGDIWQDTSVFPFNVYEWNGTNLIPFSKIPIGEFVIYNGAIVSYKTYPFNQNGYNVNMQSPLGKPSNFYKDYQLGASGSSYIAEYTGFFSLATLSSGYLQIYNNTASDLFVTAASDNMLPQGICIPCTKGDEIQVYYENLQTQRWFRNYAGIGQV